MNKRLVTSVLGCLVTFSCFKKEQDREQADLEVIRDQLTALKGQLSAKVEKDVAADKKEVLDEVNRVIALLASAREGVEVAIKELEKAPNATTLNKANQALVTIKEAINVAATLEEELQSRNQQKEATIQKALEVIHEAMNALEKQLVNQAASQKEVAAVHVVFQEAAAFQEVIKEGAASLYAVLPEGVAKLQAGISATKKQEAALEKAIKEAGEDGKGQEE